MRYVEEELLRLEPLELVKSRFQFPFEPKGFQKETLNQFGKQTRHGYGWKPGCGKTFGTVLHANYLMAIREATQWIVLMPPIVLRNWSRFLEKVIDTKTGKPVTQTLWAGTPKKRAQLSLDNQFILMSYDIFKRDFDRIEAHFDGRRVGLISDEAHKIKNMDTVNYRAVWRMFHDRPVLLATGTPVTKPDDCYTYMKFTNPGAYRNKRHFENMHVGERDEYEKVTEWVNLDELSKNFKVNWTFVEPPPTDPINFIPLVYDLAPAHLKLYNELVETQLLELDDGRVIDALNASALYHKCQQIVCNWAHFSGDPDNVSASFELVENVLDEIGDEKLVVVANYRMTTAALFEFLGRQGYHPAKVIGGMSDKQRYAEIDRFIQDSRCRVIILQPEAGGVGLDGLQHVCSEMLFLECPVVPRQFEQAYARLDREGKRRRVNCRIAVAERTIQVRLHRTLLANDELIVKAVGGVRTLREAIHGE